MSDDKVRQIRAVKAAPVDPDQAEFVEFLRILLDQAQEGTLRELHGVAVYFEEGQIDLLPIAVGRDCAPLGEVIISLMDMTDDLRAMRRGEQEEADGEED